MRIAVPRVVRPLAVIATLLASTLVVSSPAGATPPTQPTIASVRQQLDELAKKNSQLVDKYDGVQIRVAQRTAAAARAAQQSVRARQLAGQAHRALVQVLQAQYEGSGFGAAGALLDSSSTTNYLDRLDLMNLVAVHTDQVVKEAKQTRAAAATAADRAAQLLDQAKTERAALGAAKGAVEKQIGKYRALLDRLTAEQRAAIERARAAQLAQARAAMDQGQQPDAATPQEQTTTKHRHSAPPPPTFVITGAPSAKALIAVKFALAQVGKPYVFGADGPGSYDCSGLTMASWRAAGVHLPHQAAAQYNRGTHVSVNELLPGDLVFYYQPIGHVSIYIGNGLLVSAPQPGQNVEIVKLKYTMGDYTGATRVG